MVVLMIFYQLIYKKMQFTYNGNNIMQNFTIYFVTVIKNLYDTKGMKTITILHSRRLQNRSKSNPYG